MLVSKCSQTLARHYDNLLDCMTVQKSTKCFYIVELFSIIVTVITFCVAVCFSLNTLVSITEVTLCHVLLLLDR